MEYKQRRISITKAEVKSENESTVEVEQQHRCTVQLRQRRRSDLKKEGSVPTRLADYTLLLQGAGILKREICAGQSTGAVQTA